MLRQYLQDAILNWLRGEAFPGPPATIYLSAHSAATASSGNEVSSAIGGRLACTAADFAPPVWQNDVVGGAREIVNRRAFVFEVATSTIEVKSFGLWTNESGGTLLLAGDVNPDVTVTEGDPLVFLMGDLVIRLLGG